MTDCAITGPSSANSAGWPEVTTHMLPIAFQVARSVADTGVDYLAVGALTHSAKVLDIAMDLRPSS